MRFVCLTYLISLLLVSCNTDSDGNNYQDIVQYDIMETPIGFPDIPEPDDNQYTLARWNLGKKLFFDPILSVNNTVSCASCHNPSLAFSDDVPVSLGVEDRPGERNSPTLANVAYHPYFTREGGVPTLEMQILVPIQEHVEFDSNIVAIAEALNLDEEYVQMSQLAYDRLPDPYVITRALSCFERSLISGNSSYDKYTYQGNVNALTESEKSGMNLFFSERTNCFKCHSDFNFTDYTFKNNGLYEDYEDEGRMRLTGNESDRALFKVPTLRNIEVTAPYMHDGSFNTLEEVVEHYITGGSNYFNKSEEIEPLTLTDNEKSDLIAFLKSLTDDSFITNESFNIN